MADTHPAYDFVVIGAGSSGCVVAARLSEDPDVTVLLLEAGPSDDQYPAIDVPAQMATLQKSEIDWGFKTVPQQHAVKGFEGEISVWPRGKVLGGSSCLNYMAYVRGHSADYDSWETLGCDGWGWNEVLPYFMKSENNTCEEHSDPDCHGVGGPLTISNHEIFRSGISKDFIKAGGELGFKEIDINSGNNIGFGDCPATIGNGERCHTAKAFLHPAMDRNNLTVLINAHVTKIIIEDQKVVGVDYLVGDETKTVYVKKEVAVCGGAVSSPQILMLSGIGPRFHLESLGIECIADLPVGKNLQDHIGCNWKGDANTDSGALCLNDAADPKHVETYKRERKGLMANNGVDSVAFIDTGLEKNLDWPDIGIFILPMYYTFGPEDPEVLGIKSKDLYPVIGYDIDPEAAMSHVGFVLIPVLLHPKSIGEITLASTDPKASPLIDPHYLEQSHDVKVLMEGLRFSKRIAETDTMQRIGVKMVNPKMPSVSGDDAFSDDNLEQYIRFFASAFYHAVGTCKMGSVDDPTTVVDAKLRVRGIQGLRVIDASIMPHLISGNTNAPCIMIGERGADFMKSSM